MIVKITQIKKTNKKTNKKITLLKGGQKGKVKSTPPPQEHREHTQQEVQTEKKTGIRNRLLRALESFKLTLRKYTSGKPFSYAAWRLKRLLKQQKKEQFKTGPNSLKNAKQAIENALNRSSVPSGSRGPYDQGGQDGPIEYGSSGSGPSSPIVYGSIDPGSGSPSSPIVYGSSGSKVKPGVSNPGYFTGQNNKNPIYGDPNQQGFNPQNIKPGVSNPGYFTGQNTTNTIYNTLKSNQKGFNNPMYGKFQNQNTGYVELSTSSNVE